MSGRVRRLLRVGRNVSDLGRIADFYCEALGFSVVAGADEGDSARLTDRPGTRARTTLLRLGEQELGLTALDPPGRAYPPQSRANDLWFQHLALVVADMDAAYERLRRHPFTAVTEDGPQRLPPNTGSVTAFKFRDPDGHPLELIHFPPGTGDPRWQRADGVFLGIDHSAIAVADAAASVDFYTRLPGFSVAGRGVNSGPEQARLDGLPADVRVDVVALRPGADGPPHLELLGYERPAGRPLPAGSDPDDIAADRLILEVENLAVLARGLEAEGARFVSADAGEAAGGHPAVLVRDPSGHLLMLVESFGA